MPTSDSEQSGEDSGADDDPRQSSMVPKSSLHHDSDFAAGLGSGVPVTPEKSFETQEGQSDDSDHHHAKSQKRRRLPTKRINPAAINDSDSDGVESDSLFDYPSSHKRGFKRPRLPWCLVKEWDLDECDQEFAYEEIRTIMEQSLIDAGSKVFIRPNSNSIAGWRPKQVIYAFFSIILDYKTNLCLVYRAELCVAQISHQAQYLCLSIH
jgi:hypothetical protein